MTRSVHVVPHTHWDREWYEPFPTFRVRLVDLLDELLPRLEAADGLRHFQLDGQMAVIDDYLEVRPGAAAHLQRLNGSGRLSMGPWYVLPDEFLVSGETLVRNLQLGFRRAAALGGAMEVGYLPDMFGHVASMPQLLSLFGIEDAVLWRGVPSTVDTPSFRWCAPDGSEVRVEYLPAGYGNGSDMPADAATLAERIDLFATGHDRFVGDGILWMAGMDHEVPPSHLSRVVAELDREDGWSVRIGSLREYLDSGACGPPTAVHRGELRSGARANLLMGVTSNRVDVKVAAARAERSLERLAEPLVSLWAQDPLRWTTLLDTAWRDVIRNAAHDSICACSHDEVVDAVLHRYAEATRTATAVADRAVADAAKRLSAPGIHLLNPTSRRRSEVVELEVPVTADPGATQQVLEEQPGSRELHRTGSADAPIVVERELVFEHPEVVAVRFTDAAEQDGGAELELHLLPTAEAGALSPADALAELARRCAADAQLRVVTVLHLAEATRRVLAMSPRVPGFGWARWRAVEPDHLVTAVGELGLSNSMVTVAADPTEGTFSVDGVGGFGQLVDTGDAGDTYNWNPPEHDVRVDSPAEVAVTRIEAGPLRGRIVIDALYLLPGWVRRRPDRTWERVGEAPQRVRTTVELRADEPIVRVRTELDHVARDHRLRVHLPLPRRTDTSVAECAYGSVRRPLTAEGGANEWGVPTFPSRRFVGAGGLTVTHQGLCEYELVDLDRDDGSEGATAGTLALTLVRATGWLSRGPMRSRPLPAGPELALEGAQVRKELALEYALTVDPELDPHDLADRAWSPLVGVASGGGGELPPEGSHLQVRGAEVDAVLHQDGLLVVRAHESQGLAGELVIEGRTGTLVDLRGRALGAFDGRLALRPHQIATIRLDPPVAPT